MDWYFIDSSKPEGKRRSGPWSARQMTEFSEQGAFMPDTLIWKEGYQGWKPWAEAKKELELERNTEVVKQVIEEQILPQLKKGGVSYAGFWLRLCAFAIDTAVLQLIFILLTPLHSHFGIISEITPQTTVAELIPTLCFAFALICLYDAFFVKNYSGTIGKIAFGLAVVRQNGEAMTWSCAFLRAFVGFFSSSLFGIGCLLAAFDQEKRAFHDFIANTRVLKLQRAAN